MIKLKLETDGQTQTFIVNIKVAKGIYVATEKNMVLKNMRLLKIHFEEPPVDYILQTKTTKLGSWAFLTTRVLDSYFQYIFMSSANEKDVYELAEDAPDPLKQNIFTAFSLCKLNNLGQLQSLD
jgi:hypothetical protein